jgi:hypothetical protein
MKRVTAVVLVMGIAVWLGHGTGAMAGDSLASIFSEGTVSGNVRSYLNVRDFDDRRDQGAYALGGVIRGETANVGGLSLGGALYLSDDLGTKHDDPRRVLGTLPESLEVLGEAYVKLTFASTQVTAGRIKIDTPFANPSDAFIVPVTFEGLGVKSQPFAGVTLEGYYLTRFKNRSDEKFLDVGDFVGTRLAGLSAAQSADQGTAIAGVTWANEQTRVSVFGYLFTDYFATGYVEARHSLPPLAGITPYVGAQYIYQRDSGDDALADGGGGRVAGREVDGQAAGALLGAKLGSFDLSVAYNHVARRSRALLGGAILAPYSFATSAVFTNSMVDTLENSDSGSAYKATLGWKWGKRLDTKLSVASYERDQLTDSVETDVDVTYFFQGTMDGLSFRVRLGVVQASDRSRRLTNLRTQLQYVF